MTHSDNRARTVSSELRCVREKRRRRTVRRLRRARLARVAPGECRRLENLVITDHLDLALAVARRYRSAPCSRADIEQVARLGLVKACRRFDLDKGSDFVAFAVPTILGEVKRYFRDSTWAARPPRRLQELRLRISRESEALSQLGGRRPDPALLADHLRERPQAVRRAILTDGSAHPTSLDALAAAGDGSPFSELLGSEDPRFGRVDARLSVDDALERLSAHERELLHLRFDCELTQQQIAVRLGVTQMQISRLLARLLTRLHASLAA